MQPSLAAPHASAMISDRLREALAAYALRDSDPETLNRCRAELRDACAVARSESVRVEALVLAVKREWWLLPEVVRSRNVPLEEPLARVVTACIEEYFSAQV